MSSSPPVPPGPPGPPGAEAADGQVLHHEQLRVPPRWWALGAVGVFCSFLAVAVALPPLGILVVTSIVAVAILGGLSRWGAAVVEVRGGADGELLAGRARLPLSVVSGVEELDAARTRLVVGREADARAYLVYRGWLAESVRVRLDDPRDPTPYWVVSTRHPTRLAAAIRQAGQTSRSRPTA